MFTELDIVENRQEEKPVFLDSGSSDRKVVRVRVPPSAPKNERPGR